MSDKFNPYREWLGLNVQGPASLYELLGLRPFESDVQAIVEAAEHALSRVRGFRPGANATDWADLLDELESAKSCLTDPVQRNRYDRDLRNRGGTSATTSGSPAGDGVTSISNEDEADVDDEQSGPRKMSDFAPNMYPPGMTEPTPSAGETDPDSFGAKPTPQAGIATPGQVVGGGRQTVASGQPAQASAATPQGDVPQANVWPPGASSPSPGQAAPTEPATPRESVPSRPRPRSSDGAVPPSKVPMGTLGGQQTGSQPAPGSGTAVPDPSLPGAMPGATPGTGQGVVYSQPGSFGAASPSTPQQATPVGQPWAGAQPAANQPMPGQPYVPQGQPVAQTPNSGHSGMVPQTPVGQPMPGQPMPGQPMPGQPMPGQPMPGQPMPGQPMPGQPMPGQPMTGQPMMGQPMMGQPMTGYPMAGQPMMGQPMVGQQPVAGQPVMGQPISGPVGAAPSAPSYPGGASPVMPAPVPEQQDGNRASYPGNVPGGADPMAPVSPLSLASAGTTAGVSSAGRGATPATTAVAGTPLGQPTRATLPPATGQNLRRAGDGSSKAGRAKKDFVLLSVLGACGIAVCVAFYGLILLVGGGHGRGVASEGANSHDDEGVVAGVGSNVDDRGSPPDAGTASTRDDGSSGGRPDNSGDNQPGRDLTGSQPGGTPGTASSVNGGGGPDSPTVPNGGGLPGPVEGGAGIGGGGTTRTIDPPGHPQPPVGGGGPTVERPAGGGEPSVPPPSERELVDLGRALQRARTALGAQDFVRASREWAAAEQLARLPEHRQKVERLRLLIDYTEQFWAAFNDGLKGLRSTQELMIDGDILIVVEIDRQRIILRGAGRNKTFPMSDLPDKLVMAIADRWFDKTKSSTKVFKGAFYAAGPNANPAEARRLWEEAQRAGADVADLIPVLDDTYDLTRDLDR